TPITAYDIMPYGGALSFLPSASLLFPRTSWGRNYVAMVPHTKVPAFNAMWLMLVGLEDGTKVDVLSPASLPKGPYVSEVPGGVLTQIPLKRGQVLQWESADPTGAILQSDKPVGVWTGNTFFKLVEHGGGDAAHQELSHVQALGNEYVGAGIVTR